MSKTNKVIQLKTERFEKDFEAVYTEYFRPLYIYALSLTKSDDISKDVVSDVFMNLWKSNSDLSHIKQLKPYLFRSVKNQIIRTLSSDLRNFNSLDTEIEIQQIEQVGPEEIIIEKELLLIIKEAVDKLPDQCRLIFEMAKNEQKSYSEISKELGISQSTIKTQIARGVAAVKKAIEENYDEKNNSQSSLGLSNQALLLLIMVSLSL